MNPVAVLATVIAIALGGFGGYTVMGAIAPDQPGDDVEPGVSVSADPATVAPEDPISLLNASSLEPALSDLDSQLAAGQGIVTLFLTPGRIDAETRSGDGLIDPGEIDAAAPERIVDAIAAERPEVDFEAVRVMKLIATARGPRWYVQLVSTDPKVQPPWSYLALGDGSHVVPGGPEPQPIAP